MDEKVKADSTNQENDTATVDTPVTKDDRTASAESQKEASSLDTPSDAKASEDTPSDSSQKGDAASSEPQKEASAASAETPAKKTEKPVPPKHKFTIIDAFLVVTGIIFIFCAIGMTLPDYQNIARIAGLILVLLFVSGAFYATLHLKKVG